MTKLKQSGLKRFRIADGIVSATPEIPFSLVALAEALAPLDSEPIDRNRNCHTLTDRRFQFARGFHQLARRHSALGYPSPIEYEGDAMICGCNAD